MRILILVLSYNVEPFSDFMRASLETWDSINVKGVDTYYYHGQKLNCSDEYEMMHWKLKLALDNVNYHDYDLIFRTNSCSYIHKKRLLKISKKLPLTNCYAGWQNGTYISGAGIFFSPDVLDLLRNELTDKPHGAEDVLIGQILTGRVPMINEGSRHDARVEGIKGRLKSYHFRFKTSNIHEERYRDVQNMIKLHRRLYKL